ncbi:MAG TPA: hypothetical protein VGL42_10925 [Opitutaceae bacterium]|jgi:hypothetical protein
MPETGPSLSEAVRVTGTSGGPEFFQIIERREFAAADVLRVLRGEVAGVIFRGAIDPESCERIKRNFWSNPMRRQRGDSVPAHYLGTYHYGKELDLYFSEAETTRDAVAAVFAGGSNIYAQMRGEISSALAQQGVALRVAEMNGRRAGDFVMRSWSASGQFALAAHDDAAQLTARRQAGFEIQEVVPNAVTAVNLCLENGSGGELVYWNVIPDDATRRALGVEETGYPYAADLLTEYTKIELPIHRGDVYFFNGKYVHAVRASAGAGAQRSTISLLMGFKDPKTVVTWT